MPREDIRQSARNRTCGFSHLLYRIPVADEGKHSHRQDASCRLPGCSRHNLRRRLLCRTRSKVRGLLERRVDILLRRAVAKVPLRVCADFHRDLETIVVRCKRPISALDDGLLA